MSHNITTEDLRSTKTERALYAAMFSLLKNHSFRKITIRGICEEAYISRATFYAHFIDKYDLLEKWISEILSANLNINGPFEQVAQDFNTHLENNRAIMKNLLYDADHETYLILYNFLLTTLNLSSIKKADGSVNPSSVVLANFFAGGLISYLQWLIRHKFPTEVPLMNKYLYDMIHAFKQWQSEMDIDQGEA